MTRHYTLDQLQALIIATFRNATVHARRGTYNDCISSFALHFLNVERLVAHEYIRLCERQFIAGVPCPAPAAKREAVLRAFADEGVVNDALSSARFAELVPLSNAIKHALFPKIGALTMRVEHARETAEALYAHYFGKPMPSQLVLEDLPCEQFSELFESLVIGNLTEHLDEDERNLLAAFPFAFIAGAADSITFRRARTISELMDFAWPAYSGLISDAQDACRDGELNDFVLQTALRVFNDLRIFVKTEARCARLQADPGIGMHVSDAALTIRSLAFRFSEAE